jgi:hypothetical protein
MDSKIPSNNQNEESNPLPLVDKVDQKRHERFWFILILLCGCGLIFLFNYFQHSIYGNASGEEIYQIRISRGWWLRRENQWLISASIIGYMVLCSLSLYSVLTSRKRKK